MLNTGKFSLYSTDTEEQVVSLSQGLDRCAALLKTLLSPDKYQQGDEMQGALAKGKLAEKLTKPKKSKSTNNKASQKSTKRQSSSPVPDGRAKRPVSAEPPPPFPGASKHVHQPHACSTPRKNVVDPKPQHVRSATEPAAVVGELQLSEAVIEGGGPEKHQGVEVEPLQQSIGVNERLRKREFPAKRVKRNTERTRHKRSRSADAKKNHDPNYYCRSDFTNEPAVFEKSAPSNRHDCELHVPGYCPSMPPHFCPYHHHYHHHHPCYTFGSQYPTLSLPPPPPPSLVCPHCALPQQQQQELEKQSARKERGNHSSSGPSQRCNSAPGVRMGAKDTDRTEQPLSSAATGGGSSPSLASDVKSMQLLAEEMLSTLQHSIDTVKKATGANGGVPQLESMERSLKLYCSQLSLQCQKLLLSSGLPHCPPPPSPSPSLAHCQVQIQQLEEEKSQLLERLMSSETAYSKVRGQLDHSTKMQEALQRELESSNAQILALKKEMEHTSRLLSQLRVQKEIAEEERQCIQLASEDAVKRAKAENEDLQRQLGILSEELVKCKQEFLKESARVSQVQVSLDRAQDEIQLMKLSISEKETQLLQSQDQYLGLRQCLAYFLSDLRIEHQPPLPSSSSQPRGTHYTIPQRAVQNFQSLVNDGAVDQFLANYTSRENRNHHEESQVLNLTGTLNEYQDQRSSPSCLSEASTINISREQNAEGVNTLSVITPLQGGDGHPSRTIADLSTDIGSLSLSERGLYNKEERMVEGGSVKSQPRSSKSRDSATHSTSTRRAVHSKCTYPTTVELSRGQTVQSPSRSTISSGAQTSITGTSCWTTASEAEFRSDLASLDADIARLQMQFRVAMLTPLPR